MYIEFDLLEIPNPKKEAVLNMSRKQPELSAKDMCLCPQAPGG